MTSEIKSYRAYELGYITKQEADNIAQRVIELQKMLHTLIARLLTSH